MNVNLVKIVLRSVAAIGVCGAMSACAFNPVADPASPLASRINEIASQRTDYPRWQDFPAAPVNVPDATYVRGAVTALDASQNQVSAEIAAIDWTLQGSAEDYAASVRQRLAESGVEAPTASTPAEIEAFAESLRQRAKAPPRVDRPIR